MKRILLGVVIISLVVGFDWLVLDGVYIGHRIGLSTTTEREENALQKASNLRQSGDAVTATKIYEDLIKSTKNNIVYEQAVREKDRIAVEADPDVYISGLLVQANDARLRATARAGAIELLAREYVQGNTYTNEQLHEQIFNKEPFSGLITDTSLAQPDYVYLLEYANKISVRPIASAMLGAYYAKEVYGGNKRIIPDVEAMLAIVDRELPYIEATSPNVPLVKLYAAITHTYMEAVGIRDEKNTAAAAYLEAFDAATAHVTLLIDVLASAESPANLAAMAYRPFAPLFICTSSFKVLREVPIEPEMDEMINRCITFSTQMRQNDGEVQTVAVYQNFITAAEVLAGHYTNNESLKAFVSSETPSTPSE